MTFTFYPTFSLSDVGPRLPDVPILLPASSWARKGLATPRLPEHIRTRTTHKAADCGGFVATRIWGDYRYTADEYVDWLTRWSPTWAATMDYCCEEPITGGHASLVEARQDRTTEMAYHFWSAYRSASWCWVPTIQGWNPDDYRHHAHTLRPLLLEMQASYGPSSEWRVGIGTLCARASVKTINAVLQAVRSELPTIPLHLWGVKLDALKSLDLTNVVSSDSAAWHGMWYGQRQMIKEAAARQGISRSQYVLTVQLPDYIRRVQQAVERPPALSSSLDLSPLRGLLRSLGWTLRIRTRARGEFVYLARRQGTRVQEVYLMPLSELLKTSLETVRERAHLLGNPASWDDTPQLSQGLLWSEADLLGNPAGRPNCPTQKGGAL